MGRGVEVGRVERIGERFLDVEFRDDKNNLC